MRRFVILYALAAAGIALFSSEALARTGHGAGAPHTDRTFLSAMIGHHEEAVTMARDVLQTTKDPDITRWAKAIIADQNKEIALMRDMLRPLGGVDEKALESGRMSMSGHKGHMADADAAFIVDMLAHHNDALTMSGKALVWSSDPNVLDLAKNIVTAQAAEMREYKTWLRAKKR